MKKLEERLHQFQKELSLHNNHETESLIQKLVFGAAIGALEAFLYETMRYWVENDDQVLHDIITKHPVFRDKPIKLGDVFQLPKGLKNYVKGYLQTIVWDRWEKVAPLFRYGLGFSLPDENPFKENMKKRHDIIHRSGHSKEGTPIEVTMDEIYDLCAKIKSFSQNVDKNLASRSEYDLLNGAQAPDL